MPRATGFVGSADPPELQQIARRAERFCRLLEGLEAQRARTPLARAWLVGRTEEIAAVLHGLVGDWRSGVIALERVVESASTYLRTLHAAGERLCLLSASCPCCEPAGPSADAPAKGEGTPAGDLRMSAEVLDEPSELHRPTPRVSGGSHQ